LYDLETLLCLISKLDVFETNRTGKGLLTKGKHVRDLRKRHSSSVCTSDLGRNCETG